MVLATASSNPYGKFMSDSRADIEIFKDLSKPLEERLLAGRNLVQTQRESKPQRSIGSMVLSGVTMSTNSSISRMLLT